MNAFANNDAFKLRGDDREEEETSGESERQLEND